MRHTPAHTMTNEGASTVGAGAKNHWWVRRRNAPDRFGTARTGSTRRTDASAARIGSAFTLITTPHDSIRPGRNDSRRYEPVRRKCNPKAMLFVRPLVATVGKKPPEERQPCLQRPPKTASRRAGHAEKKPDKSVTSAKTYRSWLRC